MTGSHHVVPVDVGCVEVPKAPPLLKVIIFRASFCFPDEMNIFFGAHPSSISDNTSEKNRAGCDISGLTCVGDVGVIKVWLR